MKRLHDVISKVRTPVLRHSHLNNVEVINSNTSPIIFIVILHFLIPCLASLATRCVPHRRIISPPQSQINAINMSIALRP